MKNKTYYKIIDPAGHGIWKLKYKVGWNTDPDPKPLHSVGSCQPGALYFTEAENLHEFLNYGTQIAVITDTSEIVEDNNKYKAKEIFISKIMEMNLKNLLKIPGVNKGEIKKEYAEYLLYNEDVNSKEYLDCFDGNLPRAMEKVQDEHGDLESLSDSTFKKLMNSISPKEYQNTFLDADNNERAFKMGFYKHLGLYACLEYVEDLKDLKKLIPIFGLNAILQEYLYIK